MKKLLLVLSVVMFLSSSASAGTIPEFDAVGCDALNIFAKYNYPQHAQVIANNKTVKGLLNNFGFFSEEYFVQTAGQPYQDPCFGKFGLQSHLTDPFQTSEYEWFIVLQMTPESDLNVNIYDCVLTHNKFTPWGEAQQTGRWREDGQPVFQPAANPMVTVMAYPGPNASDQFKATGPFYMDARALGLEDTVVLDQMLYSSKGIWSEGILVALPETGGFDFYSNPTYRLKLGDRILVRIETSPTSNHDIRYGRDSVMVKYIGVVGTSYYGSKCTP